MSASLGFLEQTIKTYLPEVLDRKRIMNDGSKAKMVIGEEFKDMRLLLDGLSLISKDSIHLSYKNEKAEEATKRASKWIENIQKDPDMNRNVAIFVPIIRTTDGLRQISYVIAGFKMIDVDVSYKAKPKIEIEGEDEMSRLNYEFKSKRLQFPVLVHKEVRMPYEKLINDRGLRNLLNDSFTEAQLNKVVENLNK